jgi:hypothetical protein
MTEWNMRLVQEGWNDAVAGRPFAAKPDHYQDAVSYEYGRLLVAEMRADVRNGGEPLEDWQGPANVLPRQVFQAMRWFRHAVPELSTAQIMEQETIHRASRIWVKKPAQDTEKPSLFACRSVMGER